MKCLFPEILDFPRKEDFWVGFGNGLKEIRLIQLCRFGEAIRIETRL